MNLPKNQSHQFDDISRQIGNLDFEIFHWFNHGKFSLYDLLEYVLTITGKADLAVSSFSISEAAIRRFLYLQNISLVSSVRFLFDHSTQKNKLSQLVFLNKSFEVRIANNHTKIVLIQNDDFHIVISTSSNLNENRRHENGFISTDKKTFELFSGYFNELFNAAIPFA